MSDEAQAAETVATDNPVPADGQGQGEQAGEQGLILGKFKDVDALAESYTHLEKKLGERAAPALVRPGEDATEEQVAEFNAKVRELQGVPEKPEDYGLEVPENLNEERFNEFLGWAHDNGMSPKQVKAFMELSAAEQAAVQEARADQVNGWHDTNKVAEKDQYKANTNLLDRFVALVSPDGKLKEVAGDAIHHPEVRKALLQAAQFVPEPKLKGSTTTAVASGDLPSKAEVKKRFSDPRYHDPSRRDADFVAETDALWDALHEDQTYRGGPVTVKL